MSEAHAKLSASGSAKWINCPGSISLEADIPNESTKYSSEGTAAHDLASKCLIGAHMAIEFLGTYIEADGEKWEVTPEMVDAVQQYLDHCHALEGGAEWVETRVDYDQWVPDGWGTADNIKINVLFDDATHTPHHVINVSDFKYGKGVFVDAEKNSQAMIYGLGVIQTFGIFFDFKPTDIVNCVVVQPRMDSVSTYKTTVGELLKWAKEVLIPKAEEALGDNPSFTSGEKQCRFCRAKAICPKLAEDSMELISEGFKDISTPCVLKDKSKLTNKEIGLIMEQIPTFKLWTDSIEARGFNELTAGREVPGYKLVKGRAGDKKWEGSNDEVLKSLNKLGIEKKEVVTEKIATPTAVEKILKIMKLKKDKIKDLWDQTKGKPTIAKRSDKRPEIESEVSVGFKDITKP